MRGTGLTGTLIATSMLTTMLVVTLAGCAGPIPDTPLTAAAAKGDAGAVRALLLQGAGTNEVDSHGLTPLVWASRQGDLATVNTLLDAGASLDLLDRYINGWSPLMHAIHKSQTKVALALLDRGAGPDTKAPNGCTALMMAAGEGNLEVVRVLLSRGADPRAETLDHTTALTNAVANGNTEIVKLLLEKAPDLSLKDILEDRVSLWIARLRGRGEIIAMLEKARARS